MNDVNAVRRYLNIPMPVKETFAYLYNMMEADEKKIIDDEAITELLSIDSWFGTRTESGFYIFYGDKTYVVMSKPSMTDVVLSIIDCPDGRVTSEPDAAFDNRKYFEPQHAAHIIYTMLLADWLTTNKEEGK